MHPAASLIELQNFLRARVDQNHAPIEAVAAFRSLTGTATIVPVDKRSRTICSTSVLLSIGRGPAGHKAGHPAVFAADLQKQPLPVDAVGCEIGYQARIDRPSAAQGRYRTAP